MSTYRFILVLVSLWPVQMAGDAAAQERAAREAGVARLPDIPMRDACILADEATKRYYIVASARRGVRAYVSEDLIEWRGPHIVYRVSDEMWGEDVDIRGIWAPEIHKYNGKYYLILTFDSTKRLSEQWRNWRPRVQRASQVLVSDSPLGPYVPFSHQPTLPADMMTLDGTLWIEDGVPWMVYCHEWVQIVNGTIERIQLADDLSATVGEPVRMFWGAEAPWNRMSTTEGCWVTDGPSLYRSKSGKLFMPWSGYSATGYTVGLAVSPSGTLAGPWIQHEEPLYRDNGGHSMLFERFDGQLMMCLHSPNDGGRERVRLFEVEDTGDTLLIGRAFPLDTPDE